MANFSNIKGGFLLLSFFCLAMFPLSGCTRSAQLDKDTIRVMLVVDVKVSGSREDPVVATRAGYIVFYSDYSYIADIFDDSLKQRIYSVFGRIIAEGKAHSKEFNPGRPDLSKYPNGILINDRNFIYALVETAERRLNSSNQGLQIYFTYK
jgi:hypothetical protein